MAIGGLVATTLIGLPLRAALVGEGWSDALDPLTISALLTDTSIGTAWLGQGAATLLLLASTRLAEGFRIAATALSSALLLGSITLTGHTAAGDGGAWRHANALIHLLTAGAWFGALAPVLLGLPLLKHAALGAQAKVALMRFSSAGHVVVAAVILSGLGNMFFIFGGLPKNWTQPYQCLLGLKIGLVVLMALVAIGNRYVWLPRSKQADGLPWLWAGTLGEILLAFAVIGLVAWFGTLAPTP